jgi:NADH:ubiquinone oxidoreductase subunit E
MENKLFDERYEELVKYIEETKNKEHPNSYLIAVLHKTQKLYGYLDKKILEKISVLMNLPTSHIWGVATFYHFFNLKPQGKYIISVCLGTACYVKGADKVLNRIQHDLNIKVGETTSDMLFTLQGARCIGACGLAPVIMINDKVYGNLNPDKISEIIKKYKSKENNKNVKT